MMVMKSSTLFFDGIFVLFDPSFDTMYIIAMHTHFIALNFGWFFYSLNTYILTLSIFC